MCDSGVSLTSCPDGQGSDTDSGRGGHRVTIQVGVEGGAGEVGEITGSL